MTRAFAFTTLTYLRLLGHPVSYN